MSPAPPRSRSTPSCRRWTGSGSPTTRGRSISRSASISIGRKSSELLATGKAYRCYCTPEELEKRRADALAKGLKPKYDGTCRRRTEAVDLPWVVRFRAPEEGETTFVDQIKGPISFQNDELDDVIIQRSDGTPTYNFVVVVDDATMNINLVIRGDDHINNTPRQILMYQALGYPVPEFAHVPMILGADKARLSKRHGATSVMAYRDMGYLPEAMVNYLVRLGWSHGDQEIFSMAELIEKFSLDNVGRSAGVFNPDKLLWLNAHYIKSGDPQRLGDLLIEYLEKQGIAVAGGPEAAAVVKTLQERARTLVEMAEMAVFYYQPEVSFDPEAAGKFLTSEQRPLLENVRQKLENAPQWSHDAIAQVFAALQEETGLKLGKLAPPVRVAIVGGTQSPSIFDVLTVLGRQATLARLARAIAHIAE